MTIKKKQTSLIFVLISSVIILLLLLIYKIQYRIEPEGIKIGSFNVFDSYSGNFFVNYPENWLAVDTPGGNKGDSYITTLIMYYDSNNYVYIEVARNIFSNNNLDGVKKWGIEREDGRFYNEIQCNNLTISGNVGIICEYTISSRSVIKNTMNHCINWYTINNQDGYIFRFCSNEKSWEYVEQTFYDILYSINFK